MPLPLCAAAHDQSRVDVKLKARKASKGVVSWKQKIPRRLLAADGRCVSRVGQGFPPQGQRSSRHASVAPRAARAGLAGKAAATACAARLMPLARASGLGRSPPSVVPSRSAVWDAVPNDHVVARRRGVVDVHADRVRPERC
jgi:hypothetical protein